MKKVMGFVLAILISGTLLSFALIFTKTSKPSTEIETQTAQPQTVYLDNSKTLNETLSSAIGEEVYSLHGEYELQTTESEKTLLGNANTKRIVLDGGKQGATITATGAGLGAIQAESSATIEFRNITFYDKTAGGAAWTTWALEFGGNLRFEKCTFPDVILLKDNASATFEKCQFESSISGRYSVWVYDGNASFTNCIFVGQRGLKIHEELGSDVESVIVKNCIFQNLKQKPGIVVGIIEVKPKETTLQVTDSQFIGCKAWDTVGSIEGIDGYYETDTPTANFNFISNGNVIR